MNIATKEQKNRGKREKKEKMKNKGTKKWTKRRIEEQRRGGKAKREGTNQICNKASKLF